MEHVGCTMRNVGCAMWNIECENVECAMRNIECENVECRFLIQRNEKCRIFSITLKKIVCS